MSIIDNKTHIILDRINKIGSGFQKMFKTEFGLMKISAGPTVLVNFQGGIPPPSTGVRLIYM